VDYDGEVTYFAFEHLMLWERQIASALQSSLDFGYFVAQRVRGDRRGELKVFPVGQAIMTGRLRARATHSVEGRLAAGVTGYFDRIRDVVQPRGQAQAELMTYIPAHWAAGFNFGFFTPISRDPVVLADGTLADDETVLRLQTPVTYTINDRTAFEFGTVFSIRGSHLTTDDFRVGRFEAWAYVAVRVGGGTARGGEEVGDRGEGPIGVGNTGIGIGTGGRY
jgi:hypothetical protein